MLIILYITIKIIAKKRHVQIELVTRENGSDPPHPSKKNGDQSGMRKIKSAYLELRKKIAVFRDI